MMGSDGANIYPRSSGTSKWNSNLKLPAIDRDIMLESCGAWILRIAKKEHQFVAFLTFDSCGRFPRSVFAYVYVPVTR